MKKKLFNSLVAVSLATACAFSIASCGANKKPTTTTTTTVVPTQTTPTPVKKDPITGTADSTNDIKEENYIYVSNTGSDTAAGTKNDPTSFTHAYDIAQPGDAILLAAGTYSYEYRLNIGLHGERDVYGGTAGRYITIRPENEGDRVIFDFSKMAFDGANRGFQVYGDFWNFYGIEIYGAGDNGMYIAGSHNIVNNCLFYGNSDTGLQLGRSFGDSLTIDKWPSYNLIKNCTSFGNYDGPTFGENADGFAAKLTVGYGNIFDGCIAFRNSDDGWDLYAKTDSGNIGQVIITNCVSFENGYLPYQIEVKPLIGDPYMSYNTMNGDGIGFKLGGSVMEGDVLVENSLTFDNKLHGIGDNSNPGYLSLTNVTSVNNCSGVNEDGTISSVRGIKGSVNNQNNIDLARATTSYNNFYGILSYINNQKDYKTENDSAYNEDKFRGSTAYSIFNTGYDKGEVYTAFTAAEDASIWHSNTTDITYSTGTKLDTPLTDDIFKSMPHMNVKCDSFEDLGSLVTIHTQLRNKDHSVNLGDAYALKDEKLLTYCEGNPIGAVLNKSSYEDYNHFGMFLFTHEDAQQYSEYEVEALAAYSVTVPVTNQKYTFQSFELPKLIRGCDISWKSSNPDIINISSEEEISVSSTVYSMANVHIPEKDTKVTLTATITYKTVTVEKSFDVNVIGRTQYLGELKSSNSKSIRVDVYGDYVEPRVYALDLASTYGAELPLSEYSIVREYSYATDGKAQFHTVDGVYTSVPGVYEVKVTATYTRNAEVKSYYTYRVYVVDPDCTIDFTEDPTVTLTSEGFNVTGNLSNIDGYVVALTSDTPIEGLTAEALLANENAQYTQITEDNIVAKYTADNFTVKDGTTQYYGYYVVVNRNKSHTSNVYSFETKIKTVSTHDQFLELARKGKYEGVACDATTIYSLTTDLDFKDYVDSTAAEGNTFALGDKNTLSSFGGLFNGNDHTISNITLTASSADKNVGIFFKLAYGTIMNVNFNEIKLTNLDQTNGKNVGIVATMCGGYIDDVHMTNISAKGREGIGALVGQVSGGLNTITRCSLVNPAADISNPTENPYIITAYNKYAAGIVGNGQKDTTESLFSLVVNDCYVNAIIGDGNDAGGNMAGIIGRVKNDATLYYTEAVHNVFLGTVISNGQYTAGIIGDFDNGLGYVLVSQNYSDAQFVYSKVKLNATEKYHDPENEQNYAHKNSNPIVGRAVLADVGIYVSYSNIGSFNEYYSKLIISESMVWNLREETDEGSKDFALNSYYVTNYLSFDIVNTWSFDEETHTLTLKNAK